MTLYTVYPPPEPAANAGAAAGGGPAASSDGGVKGYIEGSFGSSGQYKVGVCARRKICWSNFGISS